MALKKLWRLFPVVLKPHDPAYFDWYEEQRELLAALPFNIKRISHIGSTAVPGLIAKPTVDILLEIGDDCDADGAAKHIINAGWILMSDVRTPEVRLSFNKGYTENGYTGKVYHLHLRRCAGHDELYFRDYLLAHKDIADEYAALKLSLLEKYKNDRDGYTEAKTEFIKKYTRKARDEFGGRYK